MSSTLIVPDLSRFHPGSNRRTITKGKGEQYSDAERAQYRLLEVKNWRKSHLLDDFGK